MTASFKCEGIFLAALSHLNREIGRERGIIPGNVLTRPASALETAAYGVGAAVPQGGEAEGAHGGWEGQDVDRSPSIRKIKPGGRHRSQRRSGVIGKDPAFLSRRFRATSRASFILAFPGTAVAVGGRGGVGPLRHRRGNLRQPARERVQQSGGGNRRVCGSKGRRSSPGREENRGRCLLRGSMELEKHLTPPFPSTPFSKAGASQCNAPSTQNTHPWEAPTGKVRTTKAHCEKPVLGAALALLELPRGQACVRQA